MFFPPFWGRAPTPRRTIPFTLGFHSTKKSTFHLKRAMRQGGHYAHFEFLECPAGEPELGEEAHNPNPRPVRTRGAERLLHSAL